MNAIKLDEFKLIGLALKGKTTNESGQSSIDCGNLWKKFEEENYSERIPSKLGEEVYAVYHQYEGDHTKPFSYLIGCKVKMDSKVPDGLESLIIPKGIYSKFTAIGKMPDCMMNAWKDLWDSGIPRAYEADFEIYDEHSKDWSNAKVEIYISISKV